LRQALWRNNKQETQENPMAQYNLTLKDAAGNAIGQYNIETAGAAQHIQAVNGAYYQITDLATGIGPDSIITDRVGDDLLISFDRDQSADLVIENYFSQGQPGALVGLQENGGLFNYPVATMPEHVLAEQIAAVKDVYKTIYHRGIPFEEARADILQRAETRPELAVFKDFLAASTRGIIR